MHLIYMSLSKLQELVMVREAWRAAVHRITVNQRWMSDWLNWTKWKEFVKAVEDEAQIIFMLQLLTAMDYIIIL